ncbi:MAG: RrF2 family transcriptional regulator [Acidimicrobiales bacterium]
MNMTLSKRGDYVMRSAITLARAFDTGTPRKIREVVADTDLPRTFASQILADLVRAGLALSKAGRDGGYWLARPPAEISVLEVIEAAEGPLHAERCALGDGPCRWEKVCPLHETWVAATARLNDLLAETSLAELAARDVAIEAGLYAIPADSHRGRPVEASVADGVHVELPAAAVADALSRGSVRTEPLVAAASETGILSARAAPASPPLSLQVAEWSLEETGRRSRDGSARFALVWRLIGPRGSAGFEGELSVHVVDDERSEVRAAGTWHQHTAGTTPPTASLEEAARRTLRRFLRQVARNLEEGSPAASSPGTPARVAVPAARHRRPAKTGAARSTATG